MHNVDFSVIEGGLVRTYEDHGMQRLAWALKNMKLITHVFENSLPLSWCDISWGRRSSWGPGQEALRPWCSEMLSWGKLRRKHQGVCASAQCGVHFHLSLWAGSNFFFSAKSLKVHPYHHSLQKNDGPWEATQLPESEREHRFPQRDLAKLLEDAEHGVQRKTQKAGTEAPALCTQCRMKAHRSTGITVGGSVLEQCAWSGCGGCSRWDKMCSKRWWPSHSALLENGLGHSDQDPGSSNTTKGYDFLFHDECYLGRLKTVILSRQLGTPKLRLKSSIIPIILKSNFILSLPSYLHHSTREQAFRLWKFKLLQF